MGRREREKALKFQGWVAAWLEGRGWHVANLPIGGRWARVRDIFGADVIAKRGRKTLWIQAKGGSRPSLKPIAERFARVPWVPTHDMPLVFIERSRGKVAVLKFSIMHGTLKHMGKIVLGVWIPASGTRYEF